ncbi:hypothetical protein HMPREF9371_2357 [Neisseria shayeganii 871]|uniref:RHS protein conserved region domain-containing protein n=1 Tax=Neisseria shayeganii 871 TaxID=1032488 RepID=G4CL66_9NEIS|nr:hypothetical protein HMPREF9371_2357 [Neisseria shayeganii 871]
MMAYDLAGNRIHAALARTASSRPHASAYVHDNLVRVLGDRRFFYDAHDRLVEKRIARHTVQRFEWDENSRLRAVHTTRYPDTARQIAQSIHMRYDALGRRILKHDAFGPITFIWEGMRLIEERRGSSVISYVYEPGSYAPIARLDALGNASEQGGLGTTADAAPDSVNALAAAANDAPSTHAAANDAEARYWASLEHSAKQNAQAFDHLIEQHWGANLPLPEQPPQIAKVYYFHNSPAGLPEELTNAQGQIVWQASYKTWGNTIREVWQHANLDGSSVFEQDKGDMPDEQATQTQSAETDEEAPADEGETDTERANASQCPVVDGFHGRHALRRPTLPHLQCTGRRRA